MPKPSSHSLIARLGEITGEPTAHDSGLKQIFRSNNDMPSHLTQVAFGTFKKGEICEEHVHPTMDEYFFFLEGKGVYTVDGEEYELSAETFLEIPAGMSHTLRVTGDVPLKFVYWGIARET